MVIGTGTANANRSGQTSGGNSPVVPGTPTSSDSPGYVTVPIETILEELHHKRLEIGSPRSLLGNSESLSGNINLPVPLSGEKDSPSLSAGWNETLLPAAQAGGSSCHPDTPIRITDTASINFRREIAPFERADFVPHVQLRYPLLEVGTGKIKDEFCGTFKLTPGAIAGACRNNPDGHKPAAIPLGCSRRECPSDWGKWALRAAKRVSGHVNGYLNQKYKNQKNLIPGAPGAYLPDHVMISPGRSTVQRIVAEAEREISRPDMLVADSVDFHRAFWRLYREEEARIIDMLGITGCIAFPHDIRLRSSKESDKADRAADANRYREVLDREDWNDYVKFSPHSHMVTDGCFIPMTSDELYDKTGWIYRNLGEITNCEALVYYLMSHAPVIAGMHNDRPLGSFHPSRLAHIGTIKIEVYPKCPECIAEGLAPEYSEYVVGIVAAAEYERNDRGRRVLKSWIWEAVTNKPYRRMERMKTYRILQPGERIDRALEPKWSKYYTVEQWAALPDEFEIRLPGTDRVISSSKPLQWV